MIDYAHEWKEFQELPLEEKKKIALNIISQFRWKWEIFDLIFEYLTRGNNITEQDCIDVYQSLMKTSFGVESENEKLALEQLNTIKAKWLRMKEIELSERKDTEQDAIQMINSL